MSSVSQLTAWESQLAQARKRLQDGGGKPGVATREQIAGKSGRQFLEAMMSGELPYPHKAETLGFELVGVPLPIVHFAVVTDPDTAIVVTERLVCLRARIHDGEARVNERRFWACVVPFPLGVPTYDVLGIWPATP